MDKEKRIKIISNFIDWEDEDGQCKDFPIRKQCDYFEDREGREGFYICDAIKEVGRNE